MLLEKELLCHEAADGSQEAADVAATTTTLFADFF
jgi:hypothetical protein